PRQVTALLTDEQAVDEAARLLKIGFTDGDTWESVTSPLFLLTVGAYETGVSWSSSKPHVIAIPEPTAATIVAEVHRQPTEESVILTAVVSKNGSQKARTFLLIIKADGAVKE